MKQAAAFKNVSRVEKEGGKIKVKTPTIEVEGIFTLSQVYRETVNKNELVVCSRNLDTNPRIIQQHQRF